MVEGFPLEIGHCLGEVVLPGEGGWQVDPDASVGYAQSGCDLEEAESQGAALEACVARALEAEPSESGEQDVGEGGEIEAQLIGGHLGGGGAVASYCQKLWIR